MSVILEGRAEKAARFCLAVILAFSMLGAWPSSRAYAEEPAAELLLDAQAAAAERAAEPQELGYIPDEIVVVYEPDATAADQEAVADVVGAEAEPEVAEFETGDVAFVDIDDDATVDAAVEAALADDAVKYAFPNYVATLFDEVESVEAFGAAGGDSFADTFAMAPADELVNYEWYLDAVGASGAWATLAASGASGGPVTVAVLDTGAATEHPDLANVVDWARSGEVVWDSAGTSASMKPLRGDGYENGGATLPVYPDGYSTHGTHVAGIIAAEAGNGGTMGVASGGTTALKNQLVKVVAVDVFSDRNSKGAQTASSKNLYFGLDYARDIGASVVNMSLGFYVDGASSAVAAMSEKMDELAAKNNMVIVCAAGNDNVSTPCYPAACDSTLGVVSVSRRGNVTSGSTTFNSPAWETDGITRSSFSNYGDWCDISAPGEAIISSAVFTDTVDGGYQPRNDWGVLSGTSMAAPVVAASAALVRCANPQLKAAEVSQLLCATASDLNTSGKDAQSGYGMVNAEAAVKAAPSKKSMADVEVSVPSLTYNGAVQTVVPTVKFQGTTLKSGTDYKATVSPATIKNAGTYTVTIEGMGDYVGTAQTTFAVNPASLSSAQIQAIGDVYYTGAALKPSVKVVWQGKTLTSGTDYTVAYANNTAVGTGKVTVTGRGNFTGSLNTTFSILGGPKETWKSVGGSMFYYDSYGNAVTYEQVIEGKRYYFNSKHQMQVGWLTWMSDGRKSYFKLGSDGKAPAVAGWQGIGGKWYYFDQADGRALRGMHNIDGNWFYFNSASEMVEGWVTWSDGTKSYFASGSGRAKLGWQQIGGKWYYFDPSTGKTLRYEQVINGNRFYFNSKSEMQEGWLTWLVDGSKSYFSYGSGRAKVGWQKVGGKWYYFNPTTGRSVRYSQKISGNWFYFNSQYQMHEGWLTWMADGSKSYFAYGSGRAKLGWQQIGGKWYYFNPATGKSLRYSQKIGGNLFYFNAQSQMVTGWVTWSDGSRSYFDPKTGRAATGYRAIAGKMYYFNPLTCRTK